MENEVIKEHIGMLGLKVKDSVTGFKGVVSSISFDLYGCVQAAVTPKADKTEGVKNGQWFDVARLEVLSETPVMDVPNFETGDVAKGLKGAAEKPGVPR